MAHTGCGGSGSASVLWPAMAGETFTLRVTSGGAAGTLMPASDVLVFGRKEQGSGSLGGDPELSSRHAQVYEHDGWLVVNDLGSTNGTFVNGDRVTEPRYLQPGDTLRMGGTTMVVESGGGTQTGAVPASDGGTQMGAVPASDGGTQMGAVPAAAPPASPGPPAAGPAMPATAPLQSGAGRPAGSNSNKTLIIVASILGALVLIGGIVGLVLALTGGDDDKKDEPKAAQAARPKPAAPATPPKPAPSGDSNGVSAEDQEAIKTVIEEFRTRGNQGDSAGACQNVTDDFSFEKEATECPTFVSENADSSATAPLQYERFEGGSLRGSGGQGAEVTATSTDSGQTAVWLMDKSTGSWLISDISSAN